MRMHTHMHTHAHTYTHVHPYARTHTTTTRNGLQKFAGKLQKEGFKNIKAQINIQKNKLRIKRIFPSYPQNPQKHTHKSPKNYRLQIHKKQRYYRL